MGNEKTSFVMLEPDVMKEIDLFLEDFYPNSIAAGTEMATAGITTSQIRGLEMIIVSASRFSEVLNYIKNQAGKDKRNIWIKVAPLLLNQLAQLEEKTESMRKDQMTPSILLYIKMKLARGWGKQVVSHYLYHNRAVLRKKDSD